ncbi:MAG: endonuclease/exonuclease/phosphatase family protein [Verrucomicrobiales bacterium]
MANQNDGESRAGCVTKFLIGFPADVIIGLVTAATLFCWLARKFYLFDLFTHFRVYYVIGALLAAIISLVISRRWHAAVAGALAVWHAIGIAPYYFGPSGSVATADTSQPTDVRGKALVANLNLDNTNHAAAIALLEQEKPDIAVLMEVTDGWREALRATADAAFPHQVVRPKPDAFGIWLLSKHPLTNTSFFPDQSDGAPWILADASVNGQMVHLVAAHPFPPMDKATQRQRNGRLGWLEKHARDRTLPTLAMGDLNCTPWSPYFRDLVWDSGLRDSALGFGVQPTWRVPPLGIPAIPIDHCLVTPGIAVLDRRVGPDIGSDHLPVIVEFEIQIRSDGLGLP